MLTGGALTPGTALGLAQLDLEELRAVTDRAHQLARRVAAHAHGTAGIQLAVAAGVDTIEHCGFLDFAGNPGPIDDRLVEQMAERGQVVVIAAPMPSGMVDTDADTGRGVGAPDPARVASLQRAWRNAASLRRAGVQVALGSDSFFGQFSDFRDLIYRAEAIVAVGGWSPSDVLGLLTSGGAAALGRNKEIGRLAAGAKADLLVVDGDPSQDMTALRRVLAVYRSGRLVSNRVSDRGRD
jgi:imidazolonepropionase-like amidohydrolase